jgi:hypothetical protein
VLGRRRLLSTAHHSTPLNEPQRRHFEVLLAMLEDAITEIQRLADPRSSPSSGSLTRYADDLPPTFAAAAGPLLDALRAQIGRLSADLSLTPRHRSRRRAIRALLLAETVRIEDSHVDALRGYGTVDPSARAIVQPVLDEIHATLATLVRLLDAPPPARPPAQSPRDGG